MKKILKKKCRHKNTYEKATISFIFIICEDCGKELDVKTNRDPTVYNNTINSPFYSPY